MERHFNLASQLCVVAVASVLLLDCGRGGASEFKVALLTTGPISDAGWNAGAYEGLMRIRDSLRALVSHVETRTPAGFEEAFRDFASRGYRLVFGHGFEFQDAAARVGDRFPNTVFITTSGSTVRANVAPLVFRLEAGTYLGFAGGAQAVRPNCVVLEAYVGNFEDVAAAKENALAQIRRGADIILHNADAASFGVFQAARESPGVLATGANREQNAVVPDVIVASATLDVPHVLLEVARQVKEGRFQAGVMYLGLGDGVVDLVLNPALAGRVPAALRTRIAAARDSIIAGTLQVPRVEFVSGSVPVARR